VIRALALSVVPTFEHPERASRLFVDHVTSAAAGHVARTSGGMADRPLRGGLTAWQERRDKELVGCHAHRLSRRTFLERGRKAHQQAEILRELAVGRDVMPDGNDTLQLWCRASKPSQDHIALRQDLTYPLDGGRSTSFWGNESPPRCAVRSLNGPNEIAWPSRRRVPASMG
jgi:hypothetical protein